MVENPGNLRDEFALVAQGQIPAPDVVIILFNATPPARLPHEATLQAPPSGGRGFSPAVIVLVLAIAGLLFTGLIARAGFTVLAQRRLRTLGMISALGATDRHVRRVMVVNGTVVGMIGSLAGAAIGFVLWLAYTPSLQASAGHRVDAVNLPWAVIGVVMAFAVLIAMLAARRPAREIARMPIVAALSGRAPRPRPAARRFQG